VLLVGNVWVKREESVGAGTKSHPSVVHTYLERISADGDDGVEAFLIRQRESHKGMSEAKMGSCKRESPSLYNH
jgi:hypothetical protein